MRRALPIAAFVIALVASLAATLVSAAQQPVEVAITLTDFKVSMASTSIPAGVPVRFTATNKGHVMHEVVLERAGSVDQPFEINGQASEIEDIAPGETKSATWTITQPGGYQLACHLPRHFEAGMVERFTVTAAAGGQGQAGAPLQLAAPQAEEQAEHENQPAASAAMVMPQATPATLPVTGGPEGISALWWAAAAVAAVIAAVIGALRLIESRISRQE